MPAGTEVLSRLGRTMQSIFRIGNINVKDDTGVVQLRNADDTVFADAAINKIRVQGTNATNAVVLTAPAALGASVTFTLPGTDGASGQFLQTDGAGTLSFADAQASAINIAIEAFTEATTSPLTVFTPPDNATIVAVYLELIAAAGSSAGVALEVGVTGDPDAYMQADENDAAIAAIYKVHPLVEVGVAPDPVLLTLTPNAQTFTGEVYVEYATAA